MTSKRTFFDSLTIATFLGILCAPAFFQSIGVSIGPELHEKRSLAEYPAEFSSDFPKQFDSYYNDHFGLRDLMVRLCNIVRVTALGTMSTQDVVVGKEGWLFWKDFRQIENYRGTHPQLSENYMQVVATRLEKRRQWLAQQNIQFLFMIPPDKHEIYPEYLPSSINRVGGFSPLDQMLVYLRAHTGVEILDLREALRTAKNSGRLHGKTDTHWNKLGAFVAYQQLMKQLKLKNPGQGMIEQRFVKPVSITKPGGDIAALLGMKDFFGGDEPDLELVSGELPVPSAEKKLRVVMVHDSYLEMLEPFLNLSFADIVYTDRHFDDGLITQKHPDLVILERAEWAVLNGWLSL